MIRSATFQIDPIKLDLLQATKVNISLCLTDPLKTEDHTFPISGFPRKLALDGLPRNCILYMLSRGQYTTADIL
jgi:hypothetical protein